MDKLYSRQNMLTGEQTQNTIADVLVRISDAVKSTYGPYGAASIIQDAENVYTTKDGHHVVSHMIFDNGLANTVLRMIVEATSNQMITEGDGTTTTTLLIHEIFTRMTEVMKKHSISPTTLKEACDIIVNEIIEKIHESATPATERTSLENVVYTAVDANRELTDFVMSILDKIDPDTFVTTEMSPSSENTFEIAQGTVVDGTILRDDIFCNYGNQLRLNNCRILVIDGQFKMSMEDFNHFMQMVAAAQHTTLVVCTGVSESIMRMINGIAAQQPERFNKMGIIATKLIVNGNSEDNKMLDFTAAIGAKHVSEQFYTDLLYAGENTLALDPGVKYKKLVDHFTAVSAPVESIVADQYTLSVAGPLKLNDDYANRVNMLSEKLYKLRLDKGRPAVDMREKQLEIRLAKLSKRYATAYVGGENSQRKTINLELVRDAFPHAQSAKRNGIVKGCNTSVPSIIKSVLSNTETMTELDKDIFNAITDAYVSLFIDIVENSTDDRIKATDIVYDHITSSGMVPLNIRKGDTCTDVTNSAGIDICILRNAIDIALVLLTTKGYLCPTPTFE
jgi:chaperonin GroEL (HSP60 family)